ncbi:dipeptide/oligopeptide/nickel ABC transporter permease/ATP-binding protein [Streptomyces sp. NPDC004752]
MLLIITLTIIIAPPLLEARATEINVPNMLQGISSEHWLGTDQVGRDVFARTLVAARLSVVLAIATTLLATAIGVIVGAMPLVLGKQIGRVVVWVINLMVAFPGLLLAMFLSLILGVGESSAVFALALATAPGIARLTYTISSAVATADYISAARQLGVSRPQVIWRHVLPNIAGPLIINTATLSGGVLVAFSGLSYLGFGVQSPSFDWGRMLGDGLNNIYTAPAAALAPCIAILIAGITFILAGEIMAQDHSTQAGAAKGTSSAQASTVPTEPDSVGRSIETPLLRVENLSITFPAKASNYRPVAGVSFAMAAGEIIGVVGESGSGKSLMAAAVGALVPPAGEVVADRLELSGRDVQAMNPAERNRLLGRSLATVFQDPMSALNPAVRVGLQLAEVSTVHQGMSRSAAMAKAVDRLRAVRISMPERRARQYASEFSGGMRQRAIIGMGLMAEPALIIADEPTTALDVTVQREVLALLRQVAAERKAAVLFISHDIAVISEIASRVLVMYAGRIVEDLPVDALVDDAAHPYTRALVASIPDMTTSRDAALATIPGRPPEPGNLPAGCSFATRCPLADETCLKSRPSLVEAPNGRRVACWKPQSNSTYSHIESGVQERR